MLKKTIRIAKIANNLYISERQREAGILDLWNKLRNWLKKKNISTNIIENIDSLGKYLRESGKVSFIEQKLEVARSINSLIQSLECLNHNFRAISKQKMSKRDMNKKIRLINSIISDLRELKTLINKKEQKQITQNIASGLLGQPKIASINLIATTESLNEDDNSVEDGTTSEPLEEDREDI